MGWRTLGVLAAAVIAATATVTPAMAAETPNWQATLLPLPDGYSRGYLAGADGHGGYAGMLGTDVGYSVTTWNNGKVALHGGPNDDPAPFVHGESRDDTVLVQASNGGTFTLDRTGVYHAVPTGSYTNVFASAIGPCGDLAGTATDPADPSKTVVLYWPSPRQAPSVLAALPDSRPQAVDEDGTVLFNHPDGPYLLRKGVVRKLALPAGYNYSDAWSIRHGVVAGDASSPDRPDGIGLLWRSPDSPLQLDNSAAVYAANSHGLSVGQEFLAGSIHGPVAVWSGSRELGRLPAPDGLPNIGGAFVAEDGAIAGIASARPLDEGGRPVVWRLTTG